MNDISVSAESPYLLEMNYSCKHMETVWKHLTDRKIKKETLQTLTLVRLFVSVVSIFLARQL